MALRYAVPSPAYNRAYCEDDKGVSHNAPPNETSTARKSSFMEIRERELTCGTAPMSIGGLRCLRPHSESRREISYVCSGAIVRGKFAL